MIAQRLDDRAPSPDEIVIPSSSAQKAAEAAQRVVLSRSYQGYRAAERLLSLA